MAGFNAAEAVEDLTYDFTKYVPDARGEISEPSADQIETYRSVVFNALKELGLSPADIQGGLANIDFDKMFELVDKTTGLQNTMLYAAADLSGIDHHVVAALPYRVQQAFNGWIMGLFLNPED